eukprot:GHVQ01020991.1.p1 GENE.GHVQ01020991.1~~GHVQ01020991.1.p1  ORF type:complete len:744 (+),score=107.90 GHVQ01020991.1:330-2234(+)
MTMSSSLATTTLEMLRRQVTLRQSLLSVLKAATSIRRDRIEKKTAKLREALLVSDLPTSGGSPGGVLEFGDGNHEFGRKERGLRGTNNSWRGGGGGVGYTMVSREGVCGEPTVGDERDYTVGEGVERKEEYDEEGAVPTETTTTGEMIDKIAAEETDTIFSHISERRSTTKHASQARRTARHGAPSPPMLSAASESRVSASDSMRGDRSSVVSVPDGCTREDIREGDRFDRSGGKYRWDEGWEEDGGMPLPVEPDAKLLSVIPSESFVVRSAMYPIVLTCNVLTSSNVVERRKYLYKVGDDLRQDQLVIQLITIMDQILTRHGLDLKMTPYKVMALSTLDGLIEFVSGAESLSSIKKMGGLSVFFTSSSLSCCSQYAQPQQHTPSLSATVPTPPLPFPPAPPPPFSPAQSQSTVQQHPLPTGSPASSFYNPVVSNPTGVATLPNASAGLSVSIGCTTAGAGLPPVVSVGPSAEVLDTFVRSSAGYCVATYILGVGDRHLDNLLVTPHGHLFHIDFAYILGQDPKPLPPPMKICREMVDAMGDEGYARFRCLCCEAFRVLRRNCKILVDCLSLMKDAGIGELKDEGAIGKVVEKFRLELSDEEAERYMVTVINTSVKALFPAMVDKLHEWALYWK